MSGPFQTTDSIDTMLDYEDRFKDQARRDKLNQKRQFAELKVLREYNEVAEKIDKVIGLIIAQFLVKVPERHFWIESTGLPETQALAAWVISGFVKRFLYKFMQVNCIFITSKGYILLAPTRKQVGKPIEGYLLWSKPMPVGIKWFHKVGFLGLRNKKWNGDYMDKAYMSHLLRRLDKFYKKLLSK